MRHLGTSKLLLSRLALKILTILVLCGVLPAFVSGIYLLRRNEEMLQQRVNDTLRSELVRRAADMNLWVGERLREATTWATSFLVLDAVEIIASGEGDVDGARTALSNYLEDVLGASRVYESLFIVDHRGRVLAATRAERIEAWALRRLASGVDLERGLVSPILPSEVRGRPTMLVIHPIRGRRGTTLAFLVARLDLRELDAKLRSSNGGLALSYWLLDREGRALMRQGIVPGEAPQGPFKAPPDLDKPEIMQQVRLDGDVLSLCSVTGLAPPLEGFLMVTVPSADALEPHNGGRWRVFGAGLLALLAIVLALWWATRGVLRPILLLSEGARRLSVGDLNIYLPVWGRDEIGALTATFNEMIRRLREGREEIEDARDELARTNEDLRGANQTLEALAITDGLTGLYNHRHFQDTLDREIRRCDREGRPLSLLMLDIDHFKQFNDHWGHTEGDAALRRVAGQIMKTIRTTDSAFRYGGEELAVLLPGCMKDQARDVAEKARLAVMDSAARRGPASPRLTISIGVATSPEDARAPRGLVDAADAALYAAKGRGRNCVVVAGSDESAASSEI